ncbi:nucleoporin NUP188-like protein [Pyrus ussuriensis x Pyrus communis]|uniref:Nucleoporin NUP188-like protein n=1 Tax=Pyrus ussuriensis x Pyrus communis TaxID=2448454 RepID=A0A5N5FHQ2_9ROSA|nr:nucleoporin NUP188-like protein [Pyrus ussuriensis x Pyrus communis]
MQTASLNYCVEILQSDVLKEPDGPADGYRSVLRTFVSAFIASYDISLQLEDKFLKLLLDILCKIYQGEESLCIQFWDRESFIDGPILCLLCNLEGEFPFRTVELVRLLSSLCEGTWPAECVYNFLDKSVGISSLVEINGSLGEDRSQIVETQLPLHVPGFEGLVIPSKTCGRILRLVSGNTALVRWEYTQSGVLVLLMHLSQELYFDRNDKALLILDLCSRMVTFNTAVCFALMDIGSSSHFQSTDMGGQIESNMRLVEIICTLVRKLSPTSGGAALMSVGINILAKMLRCSPSRVSEVALKANIFGFSNGHNDPSRGTWFLSGKLAKMLLIDCEQNDSCCSLTISVLDFTLHLMETGLKNDAVLDLIVFSIQYVLVNHEYWKYKVKHTRWRVTLKVQP